VSYTTRPPRPGEVDGQDYCFVPEEEFLQLLRAGLLVEHVQQFGYYYGSSRTWIDQALHGHQDILFDVEIHGAKALKEHFPQGNFIFILPPGMPVLETRLRDRGSLPEPELQQRLARVRQEIKEITWYDYLIVNDELATAIRQMEAIVIAARCRSHLVWPQIQPLWD
jgi:guanylate kinase